MFKKSYPFPKSDYHDSLILRPTYGGHESVESEEYHWDRKKTGAPADFFFLQSTLSGRGQVRFGTREWRVEPGMAFLCTMEDDYEYGFDKKLSDHWEFIWLGMRGTLGQMLFKSLQKEFGKVIHLNLKSLSISQLLGFMKTAEEQGWQNQKQASTAVYGFLLQLQDDLRRRGTRDMQARMDEALRYLHDHFAEPLDVSVISPQFGYTREHFTRLFRKRKGISPGQYIQDLRLDKAKELLRTTALSLDAVAESSGLRSANYLCRQFKQRLGMTPRAYKQSLDAAVGGKG